MTEKSIRTCISEWSQKCDILDIELIIAHVIKKNRVFVITHPKHIITKHQHQQVTIFCKKRETGYPLAYIIGHKEFYGRDFRVTKNTLVPRPETELLVANVLSFITHKKISDVFIVDIGTGSGIISATLAKELDNTNTTKTIIATDISREALTVAKHNAKLHDVHNITFYHTDLLQDNELQNTITNTKCKNIIITANLPYVDVNNKTALLRKLHSRSLYYEPDIALWSLKYGLEHYQKLIMQTIRLYKKINDSKNITSFYEIDPNQSSLLTQYFHKKTSSNVNITYFKDFAEKNRIARWTLKKSL